jgi:serine/threonine-protein kinase
VTERKVSDAPAGAAPAPVQAPASQSARLAAEAAARRRGPIPGYALEREVGRGGMGIVYRARQESIGRVVAVKVLPPQAAKNREFSERFLREAKAAAKLNHENVVAAIDAGRAGDLVYFVMEFVEGETARQRLDREGPLPVEDVLRILRDIARALVHARKHGLVHRDVKPDNIMLNRDGRAQLCDLGLARLALPGGTPAAGGEKAPERTGIAEGTPYYMAPEQARGLADIDIRADLYALGATAYHLLTGEYPYDGEDARSIMLQQVNDPFPDVRAKRPETPEALAALIGRLVEKEREKRMAGPAEVVAALDEILGEGPLAPAARRRPALLAPAAGAAAALLGAVVLFAWLRAGPKPDPAAAIARPPAPGPTAAGPARPDPPSPPAPSAAGAGSPAPAARAAPSRTAREAEAALELEKVRATLAGSPESRDQARAFRAVAAAYEGTPAADIAEAEAKAIDARIERTLEKRLSEAASQAAGLVLKGEFGRAAALYAPLFREEKGGPGEAKVAAEIEKIEKLCGEALARAEREARAFAAREAHDDALRRLEDFAAHATEAGAARALALRDEIARSRAAAEAAREAGEAAERVRALLRDGRYAEALQALDRAAKDPRFEPYRSGIESLRSVVETTRDAADGVLARFQRLVGEDAEVPLTIGETIVGKVQGFDPAALAIAVREPGAKDLTPVRLRDMAPAFIAKVVAPEPRWEAHYGAGLVLLNARAVAAAAAELQAAAEERPLPKSVAAELARAQAEEPEILAAACLERARAHEEHGRFERALALAERLRTGDLKESAFARGHAAEVKAAWTRARAEQLASGPLQGYFAGKVTGKRGARATIAYTFADAREAQDWRAATGDPGFDKSKVTPIPGACEMTGRVVWRGAFRGDVTLEAVVRTAASSLVSGTPANANFVLYDRGAPWTGWFLGIAAECPGEKTYRLAKEAVVRPGGAFGAPSHVIGRSLGSFGRTDWLWASRGPAVPGGEPFRVEIAARSRRFAASFLKQQVAVPFPADDAAGGVAIVPFAAKVTIEEIRLQGVIDEDWLEAEAKARADTEYGNAR